MNQKTFILPSPDKVLCVFTGTETLISAVERKLMGLYLYLPLSLYGYKYKVTSGKVNDKRNDKVN